MATMALIEEIRYARKALATSRKYDIPLCASKGCAYPDFIVNLQNIPKSLRESFDQSSQSIHMFAFTIQLYGNAIQKTFISGAVLCNNLVRVENVDVFVSSWQESLIVVKPDTVVRWHRRGFALYWTRLSRENRIGRPGTGTEIRDLIRKIALANPLWGSP